MEKSKEGGEVKGKGWVRSKGVKKEGGKGQE